MKTIAIWCSSVSDITELSNKYDLARSMVTVVPDPEMRFSYWVFYNVPEPTYDALTSVPRLTWK